MGEFKGTKGKWIVNVMDDTFIQNEKGEIITVMHHTGVIKYETMPYNAKLISCAPELLEALKYSLRMLKNSDSMYDKEYLENLIKSATE